MLIIAVYCADGKVRKVVVVVLSTVVTEKDTVEYRNALACESLNLLPHRTSFR